MCPYTAAVIEGRITNREFCVFSAVVPALITISAGKENPSPLLPYVIFKDIGGISVQKRNFIQGYFLLISSNDQRNYILMIIKGINDIFAVFSGYNRVP